VQTNPFIINTIDVEMYNLNNRITAILVKSRWEKSHFLLQTFLSREKKEKFSIGISWYKENPSDTVLRISEILIASFFVMLYLLKLLKSTGRGTWKKNTIFPREPMSNSWKLSTKKLYKLKFGKEVWLDDPYLFGIRKQAAAYSFSQQLLLN